MFPDVRARSFPEANVELPRNAGNWAVVSIGEPETDPPLGFNRQNPLHLRLEFHDIVEPLTLGDKIFTPPKIEHVEMLIDFAKMARGARVVYCHCVAGISRSTAAAYILRCVWAGSGGESEALIDVYADRPQAWPNERMVEFADQILGRGGSLLKTLRAHQA